MRFDTTQQTRLSQQMKLAPRMIQSMEILQMPMLALQERVDQELESNIALELVERRDDEAGADQRDEDRLDERLDERELVVSDSPEATEDWQRLSALESAYEDAFDNEYSSGSYSKARANGERDRKMDALANVAAPAESLTDQLARQWSLAEVDPDVARAGRILIGYIDDDGLLSADLETILDQNANTRGEPLSLELLEGALGELQQRLDPPGVAARNHRECLLIQIDRMMAEAECDPAFANVRRLVEDHYDDLLQNRLPRIAQETGLTLGQIREAMQLMRKLTISPGRELVDEEVPPIIPDAVVEYDEDGDRYVAAPCDGLLPALRISKRYEKMSRDKEVDRDTRDFVTRNVRNAHWLIDSINQRKGTLMRVVNVVLARQRDFLDHGPQHLKPLPMIDVADQLGIHVGTVSRAVADKWLQTPRGMVPLRMFFTGGTETESGENLSWEAIKAKLKEIVDAEDKTSPLSDSALAAALKATGIDIARRTVVKYRQQLGIPPARRRKVY